MNTTKNLVTTLAWLCLAACGGTAPEPAADVNGAATDLAGTWTTACFQSPNMLYARTSLSYAGANLTGTYSEFSDAACAVGYNVSTWTGTISGGGAAGVAGAKKIDIAFGDYHAKPLTQAAA